MSDKLATITAFAKQLPSSPLQRLQSSFLDDTDISLYIKRDDLIHPQFGGNKWRKLKYNLIHAHNNSYDTLLTFGGAWSNHLYATAAAGKYFGFNTIGIIRGEEYLPLNPTLAFARDCGMKLHYMKREQYREKNAAGFLEHIRQRFGNVYILPEGGSNQLALEGCREIVDEIETDFDYICCASGTGATLAGIIPALKPGQSAIGFSALKGKFLTNEVKTLLADKTVRSNIDNNTNTKAHSKSPANWWIEDDFHFGGYAKINDDLIAFMNNFTVEYGITLDAVYTGKMFYGLFELISAGAFTPGAVIIAVHSGGLQGNKGFNL